MFASILLSLAAVLPAGDAPIAPVLGLDAPVTIDVVDQLDPSLDATLDLDLLMGRDGGPGHADTRVEAHSTDVFHIDFVGRELATISVVGDGDTDLDLFVYDENGNLIAFDDDLTDRCYVSFRPRWTGTFRVEVRNLGGVYNRYHLQTN
jgi:hypothetical protein